MTKTKLRFVVPHTLFSEGLIMILADTGRYEIDEQPDVLLVDASMIKQMPDCPGAKLVVIGRDTIPSMDEIVEMLKLGVNAYVRDTIGSAMLIGIIDLVLHDNAVWPAGVLEGIRRAPFSQAITVPTTPCNRLSPRELQLIGGIRRGMSNKEIARETQIADATVKVHVKAILRKLRLQNRTQLAVWAVSNGGSNAEV